MRGKLIAEERTKFLFVGLICSCCMLRSEPQFIFCYTFKLLKNNITMSDTTQFSFYRFYYKFIIQLWSHKIKQLI